MGCSLCTPEDTIDIKTKHFILTTSRNHIVTKPNSVATLIIELIKNPQSRPQSRIERESDPGREAVVSAYINIQNHRTIMEEGIFI